MFLTTKTALEKEDALWKIVTPIQNNIQLFKKIKFMPCFFTYCHKHILSILISVFSMGYNGKTVDFEKYSLCAMLLLVKKQRLEKKLPK